MSKKLEMFSWSVATITGMAMIDAFNTVPINIFLALLVGFILSVIIICKYLNKK